MILLALIAALPPALEITPATDSWVTRAFARELATDLERLGAQAHLTPKPRVLDPAPIRATLSVVEGATLKTTLLLRGEVQADLHKEGRLEDLDRLAAELAAAAASALRLEVTEEVRALLAADPVPLPVIRLLAEADDLLAAGDARSARLKFDRASEVWRGRVLPEALEGSWRAQAALLDSESAIADRAELARSALDRAEFARERKQPAEAIQGWSSFLRFTPDRALRFTIPGGFQSGRTRLLPGERGLWLIQRMESGGDRAAEIDPLTGRVSEPATADGTVLGAIGGDLLVLRPGKKPILERRSGSAARWKLSLPFGGTSEFLPAAGFAAWVGRGSLVWIDLGVGKLGQEARDVQVLAIGIDGALVRIDRKTIGLLRPGRKTPAWKVELGSEPSAAALIRGRAVLLGPDGLAILDDQNGRPRGSVLPLPPAPRLLGAEGRFVSVGTEGARVDLYDALGGEKTATIEGPARATAALTAGAGVAIAFESGDLVTYDRDGIAIDRALLPAPASALFPGPPGAPGIVALTPRGVIAFGEPASAERPRDVEIALRLADQLARGGDMASARRIAEWVARRSAGAIGKAELLRAQLYETGNGSSEKRAANSARTRADIAADPKKPLPRFGL